MNTGTTLHLTKLSGGRASAVTSALVVEERGPDACADLFTDTLIEDNDLYRFLIQFVGWKYGTYVGDLAIRALSLPAVWEDERGRAATLAEIRSEMAERIPSLHWIADGRHPVQVFFDVRMFGNTRMDPCSLHLKRKLSDNYANRLWSAADCIVYVGIAYHERHRLYGGRGKPGIQARMKPWEVRSPLADMPEFGKPEMDGYLASLGIARPRLYDDGFSNNNCGGACVKAGHASWLRLLRTNRPYFLWWEEQEERFRRHVGSATASVLRDRRGGKTTPLPLRVFREMKESEEDLTALLLESDHGCGGACALP